VGIVKLGAALYNIYQLAFFFSYLKAPTAIDA
jgi:hypothetical protein